MTIKLIGSAQLKATDEDVQALAMRPEFRRTTEAMRMAYACCMRALAPVMELITPEDRDQISLLVGSAYGELDSTKEFLFDYFSTQLARPTLFQNSLHNAILGFLSIQLKLRGPGITMSNSEHTLNNLLEVAQIQLQTGEATLCLVCCVDSYMEKLKTEVHLTEAKSLVQEGCTVYLLASSNWPQFEQAQSQDALPF